MSAQIKVKKLGLAAFMKANGATFIRVEDGAFVFTTNRAISEWREAHNDSCCRKVDNELVYLRNLIKQEKG